MAKRPPNWKVVQDVNHKKFLNGGVIVVEDDHGVIHFDNSSDLALSTSLNDLDFATLNIDGQSMDVDAPPYIINVDEDDDFIDDEDVVPHDLADSDDEFLVNDDDDDDVAMSAALEWGHGGGDDLSGPPPRPIQTGCRGRGGRKPNRGGRKADRLGTHEETKNLGLRRTGVPDVLPFLAQNREGEEGGGLGKAHGQLWPKIKKGIEQHMAKVYIDNKSTLKKNHWILTPGGTRDVPFKMLKTGQRARSFARRDPGHLLSSEISRWRAPRLESTRPSSRPSSTHILMVANLRRTRRANTSMGVSYTEDQIMAMVRKGKQRGHIPGVSRVLAGQGRDTISINEPRGSYTNVDVDELKDDNKKLRKELAMLKMVVRIDDRMSQLLTQLES
ncbi:hypothetical protein Tco_0453791 [Tanacetum coccineum]